ncbi:hypothetical protein [Effusibacillus dendaii]|uniref:hypothetical protein n=1 Tax=Effusibacillus dendaii TaxID=2743772 RepID=UPI001CF78C08|nr:hypothetical protein [Effusibacillus dendaii]
MDVLKFIRNTVQFELKKTEYLQKMFAGLPNTSTTSGKAYGGLGLVSDFLKIPNSVTTRDDRPALGEWAIFTQNVTGLARDAYNYVEHTANLYQKGTGQKITEVLDYLTAPLKYAGLAEKPVYTGLKKWLVKFSSAFAVISIASDVRELFTNDKKNGWKIVSLILSILSNVTAIAAFVFPPLALFMAGIAILLSIISLVIDYRIQLRDGWRLLTYKSHTNKFVRSVTALAGRVGKSLQGVTRSNFKWVLFRERNTFFETDRESNS